ncbi:unnamed protein product [Ambrosiozyma monospora]|uniref:Unnamed protein product n=1 Tax=Ambrosiozyma monospora TaxID=43982 RepID=A0ACB5TTK0_AMBMO|nr:unnamed protein product [Ambrosiozyma monospora]
MPYTNATSAASNSEFKKQLMITTGLVNLGNSCYMNSVLQCLTGAVNMTEFFLNGTYRKRINVNSKLGSKGILATEFASFESELFTHSSQSKPKSITPIRFRKVLASLNSCYRNTDQQDCFEFLNYLLDSLHEDLNQNGNHPKLPELTKDEEEQREKLPIRIASTIEWERYLRTNFSIVVDIFQGQILSQLRCLECGTTSTTYNAFSTLSLPIPNTYGPISLKQCFDEFVKPELLTADNRWSCPKCKRPTKSAKQLRISRLPQVLIIHLKRFKLENYLSKINLNVDYPTEFNLDKFHLSIINCLVSLIILVI